MSTAGVSARASGGILNRLAVTLGTFGRRRAGRPAQLGDSCSSSAPVFIVGAGPGDAELLTLKAVRLLQQADVVLFDWLVHESVLELIPRHVKTLFVGKRSGRHSISQQAICERMCRLARSGKRVVRLKGGDPALFARSSEETSALTAAGIPFAIVPGITAASGASAYTGIPLTLRDCARGVHLLTARFKDPDQAPDWDRIALAVERETVVFYMGARRIKQIADCLQQAGVRASLPVALIENACCDTQRLWVSTVADIAGLVKGECLSGPALLVLGDVVMHRQQVAPTLLAAACRGERSPGHGPVLIHSEVV